MNLNALPQKQPIENIDRLFCVKALIENLQTNKAVFGETALLLIKKLLGLLYVDSELFASIS
jgi:hypothetical protein